MKRPPATTDAVTTGAVTTPAVTSPGETTPVPTTPAATTAAVTTPLPDGCSDILSLIELKDKWQCRACSRARVYSTLQSGIQRPLLIPGKDRRLGSADAPSPVSERIYKA